MPSVRFEYSLEKDSWNVLRVITKPPINDPDNIDRPFGSLPKDFINSVKGTKDESDKSNLVKNFLEAQHLSNKNVVDGKAKTLSGIWKSINDTYFQKLESILQIKLANDIVYTCYLTSAGSCPFNAGERWFMARINDDGADATVAHEILHIEFIWKYSLYCRDKLKLSPKEFTDFQEASTFLLNDEMKGMLSRPDYGYEEHQYLRTILSQEWRKNKDFPKLLDYYVTIKNSWRNK